MLNCIRELPTKNQAHEQGGGELPIKILYSLVETFVKTGGLDSSPPQIVTREQAPKINPDYSQRTQRIEDDERRTEQNQKLRTATSLERKLKELHQIKTTWSKI